MRNRMNNRAHSDDWEELAANFLCKVWGVFADGFVFAASKDRKSATWREHSFQLPISKRELMRFFRDHPRDRRDLYFCPNAFDKPTRKKQFALPTLYAWADIDDADPDAFDPQPGVLIETSSDRYQGLWLFRDHRDAPQAEVYSKALAYMFGADRNGWSITKYLRVPFTFNHKPERKTAAVKLVEDDFRITIRPSLVLDTADWDRTDNRAISANVILLTKDWQEIAEKYRKDLHPRVRSLIWTDRAFAYERDRSKCIFEIIAGLHEAGADVNEIAFLVFENPYFRSKHGVNPERAMEEVGRVVAKLGGHHGKN